MTPQNSNAPIAETNGYHSNGANKSPVAAETPWQIVQIDVKSIVASPFQSREHFDAEELEELAQSIKVYGVQQPVLVRPIEPAGKKPCYELVAGERRWRASQLAGRKVVPALVRELTDLAAAEIAVIENVQRANLSVIEEARGYKQLAIKFRLKEERIAKKVGKSVATIKEMLRLLALPESVQNLLSRRQLSAAHGHELLRLAAHPAICEAVALRCVSEKITATSLAGNLLPNANEMKRSGLITELGFATKFHWRSVCKECPHKALVTSGYTSFCLRPDEWRKKQDGAIEMQKQEATRVMEESREQNDGTVEVERLAPGSYRRLLHVQLPAGCCESCECRSETFDDADPMRRAPICLNPDRFEQLRDAERKAHQEARKQRYTQDWKDALEKIKDDESGPALIAALLVLPILRAESRSYIQPELWLGFVQGIASHLECELPLPELLESGAEPKEGLKQLRQMPPQQMLRLAAGILLGQEAERAIRFISETPQLDFVLNREKPIQTEFEDEDDETSDFEADYLEMLDGEAEIEGDSNGMSVSKPEMAEDATRKPV